MSADITLSSRNAGGSLWVPVDSVSMKQEVIVLNYFDDGKQTIQKQLRDVPHSGFSSLDHVLHVCPWFSSAYLRFAWLFRLIDKVPLEPQGVERTMNARPSISSCESHDEVCDVI